MKAGAKITSKVFGFLAIFLLIAEFTFRFVVTAPELPYAYFDEHYRIIRYDASIAETGYYTTDRLGIEKTTWYINSTGWNADEEYVPSNKRTKPLVAIIGDSYIEGFSVDQKHHLSAYIKSFTNNTYDVYEFGTSGVNMAQFISVFNYIQHEFTPEIVLFFINEGDLRESVSGLASSPNNLQFLITPKNISSVVPAPYQVVSWKRLVRKSAFVRYLFFYFQFKLKVPELHFLREKKSEDEAQKKEDQDKLMQIAANKIIDSLVSINRHSRILFILHPNRGSIYNLPKTMPSAIKEIEIVKQACAEKEIRYIDLNVSFYSDYLLHKKKFNFAYDWHWNNYGNEVASKAIAQSLQSVMYDSVQYSYKVQ